jgi:hypothetical protein
MPMAYARESSALFSFVPLIPDLVLQDDAIMAAATARITKPLIFIVSVFIKILAKIMFWSST